MSAPRTRQRIVNAAQGALRSRLDWLYGEVRPIPYATFNQILDGVKKKIKTDCSGLGTCCYQRAGADDPNGLGYNGAGFTGTMLSHLPPIPLSKARPGDLAVFGVFPGKHVVVIVGTGSDPACISHGGPGDPKEAPLSFFLGIGPLTVLRGVPVVTPIRKPRPAKWRVVGDTGAVISHVHGTRFGWWLRHRQLAKNQHEQLAFHRVHSHPAGATNAAIHNE